MWIETWSDKFEVLNLMGMKGFGLILVFLANWDESSSNCFGKTIIFGLYCTEITKVLGKGVV